MLPNNERMKELIEWAEKTLELHRLRCDLAATWGVSDTIAEGDLLAVLDDYSALREENERLREEAVDCRGHLEAEKEFSSLLSSEHTEALSRAEKAEAELAAAQMTNAKTGAVIIEQMVALEHQRPLIEAVMGAKMPLKFGGEFWSDDEIIILREARKLREEKGK